MSADFGRGSLFQILGPDALGIPGYTIHLVRFGFQHSGDRDADEDMNVDLLQVPAKANLAA